MTVRLVTADMARPDDTAGIDAGLAVWGSAVRRLAILAKVEGTTAAADRSREIARRALTGSLRARGVAEHSLLLLSVGCEGVATPLSFLIADVDDGAPPSQAPRLVLGIAHSRPVEEYALGTAQLVEQVAATVGAAMEDGALSREEVALVLVKVPTAMHAAMAPPERISMARGRAVGALGVGVALGEIARERVRDDTIASDPTLQARRAMSFAGPEIDRIEVVALGNRRGAAGDLFIVTTMMADILDAAAIRRRLAREGMRLTEDGEIADPTAVAALLVKAGVAPDGRVRGARTLVHDGVLPPDTHMRAALSGVIGSLLGHTRFFVSGDPIQQAPVGGGIAAAILRANVLGR